MTDGFEVFVQLVIAAMSTAPSRISSSKPSHFASAEPPLSRFATATAR